MNETTSNVTTPNRVDIARRYLKGLQHCLETVSLEQVAAVIGYFEDAYFQRNQVFILGNGGSAATASHMACDLGKNVIPPKTRNDLVGFRVMALTDNVPWLTALANDRGYRYIFSDQLKNLVQPGDLVVVISGSGDTPNIIEGAKVARERGAKVIGFLGFEGGKVWEELDAYVIINSDHYGYIEDVHLALDHLIVSYFNTIFGIGRLLANYTGRK